MRIKEWFILKFKDGRYISNTYYTNFYECIDDGIKDYAKYVNELKDYLKKTHFSNEDVSSIKANAYHAGFNGYHYFKDNPKLTYHMDILKDSFLSKDKFDREFARDEYRILSRSELNHMISKVHEIEKIGEDFDKFVGSLNFSENAEKALFRFYSDISSYCTKLTNKIVDAIMKSTISKEEVEQSKKNRKG